MPWQGGKLGINTKCPWGIILADKNALELIYGEAHLGKFTLKNHWIFPLKWVNFMICKMYPNKMIFHICITPFLLRWLLSNCFFLLLWTWEFLGNPQGNWCWCIWVKVFQIYDSSVGKESTYDARDPSLTLGLGRSPEKGKATHFSILGLSQWLNW